METNIKKVLLDDIYEKLSLRIVTFKDCQYLSSKMLENRVFLSPHTLARFFGIMKSQSKPYKSTLDSLAVFLGYGTIDQYISAKMSFPLGLAEVFKLDLNDELILCCDFNTDFIVVYTNAFKLYAFHANDQSLIYYYELTSGCIQLKIVGSRIWCIDKTGRICSFSLSKKG